MDETIRGVPIWLLREYVVDAGGTERDDGSVAGDGWTATLTQVEDFQVGSLAVGQVQLVVEGDADAVARLREALEPRLLRAGG